MSASAPDDWTRARNPGRRNWFQVNLEDVDQYHAFGSFQEIVSQGGLKP